MYEQFPWWSMKFETCQNNSDIHEGSQTQLKAAAEISVPSEFRDLYQQKMRDHMCADLSIKIRDRLQSKGMYFPEKPFQQELKLKISESSINKEVVVLQGEWGKYVMEINILNIKCSKIYNKHQHEGAFGYVNKGAFWDHHIAMKYIPIRSPNSIHRVIREWFLLRIACQAEIGPNVQPYFGFDLLIYENCVQFAMEVCQTVLPNIQLSQSLGKSLALMHSLHLVHMDIKPANIMFSLSLGKPVYIDFGLSTLVKEDIGQKSLTEFIGSLSFCGEEMRKCFTKKMPMMIDLYYNDLCGLQSSLKSYRAVVPFIFRQEKYQLLSEYNHHEFGYLDACFLKFLLFKNEISKFKLVWAKVLTEQNSNQFERLVLAFLEELVPTAVLKTFFNQFTSLWPTLQDYRKIKLVYQISDQNLCSLDILKDEDLTTFFEEYCNQYSLQDGKSQSEESRELAVPEVISNPEAIKKMSLNSYILNYLEYLSFINNKYKATSISREAAAKAYYLTFINQGDDIQGLELVKLTILHVLQVVLQSKQIRNDQDGFTLCLLQLVDFISVLDMGTVDEFFTWITKIYTHDGLSTKGKALILIRVAQSSLLNCYRIKSKGSVCRMDFLAMIRKWHLEQSQDLFDKNLPDTPRQGRNMLEMLKLEKFSSQIFQAYGQECLLYYQLVGRSLSYEDQLPYLYNRLHFKSNNRQFYYFFSQLYNHLQLQMEHPSACKHIYLLFKQNLADESLLGQFSFQFLVNAQLQIVEVKKGIRIETLHKINTFFMKVSDDQVVLLKYFFIFVFNKIKILKDDYLKEYFFKKEDNFVQKYFRSASKKIQCQVLRKQYEHQCLMPTEIFQIYIVGQSLIPPEDLLPGNLLNQLYASHQKCLHCMDILEANRLLIQIQNNSLKYLRSTDSEQRQHLLNNLFGKVSALEKQLWKWKGTALWQDIMQINFGFSQNICCGCPELELQWHGIQKYYNFVMETGQIRYYFKTEYQNCIGFLCALDFLQQNDQQQFIQFLIKITAFLARSLHFHVYQTIFYYCSHLFRAFPAQKLISILTRLEESENPLKTKYLLVYYVVIFSFCRDERLDKKIVSFSLKSISNIHHFFQRQLQIRFAIKIYHKIQHSRRSQRLIIFLRHRITKMLMVEGRSRQKKRKEMRFGNDTLKEALLLKLRKIDVLKMDQVTFEVRLK